MSGLNLLAPAFLVLGLLAAPIVLMYMLKLRRREVTVSSTLLWQALLRDRQANAPWQRLRRNLLLLLQLLILACMVLALARPALPALSVASGSVVVILDASASMNAADMIVEGQPSPITRFEAARQHASELISALPAGAQMTIIQAGAQPQTLAAAESDRGELNRALAQAQAEATPAGWEAAFALAAGATRGSEDSTIVLISDGGLPPEGAPPLPAPLRYIPVGQQASNLAITAFAIRPALQTGEAEGAEAIAEAEAFAELLASVTNFGLEEQRAILSFYGDEQLFRAQEILLPPGERTDLVLSDLPQVERFEARLTAPGQGASEGNPQSGDPLPLDDRAYAVFRPASRGRLLLVSPGNFFLEQLLAALPQVEPYRTAPDEAGNLPPPGPEADYAVYVFDGVAPDPLPEGNLLLINPPSNPLFAVGEVFTATGEVKVADHPLTRYVDWSGVNVRQARQVDLPNWATRLVQAPGGPLVFIGEVEGRRVSVVTFDLHDSDLPLQVTFPILFANLLDYLLLSSPLAGLDTAGSLPVGQSVTLRPELGVEQVEITTPNGETVLLPVTGQGVLYSAAREPGFYSVRFGGADQLPTEQFAANLFSHEESDIAPADSILVGRQEVAAATEAEVGQRELWPWLVAAALAILMLEWWVYHRQASV